MPKCKVCNSCLDTYVVEEAVYYHCFLCNKLFDLKTRKELDLFSTIYLIRFKDKEFVLAGGTFKDKEALEYYIKDSIPSEDFEITQLPLLISKKFLVKQLIEVL